MRENFSVHTQNNSSHLLFSINQFKGDKIIMIKFIISDLDDTLCDYQKAKNNAKSRINEYLIENFCVDILKFWRYYDLIEPQLFQQFIKKEITRKEYRFHRYYEVLKRNNIDNSSLAKKLNYLYMKHANFNINLFDDVKPFFEFLAIQKIQLAILTNGPLDGQKDKIRSLNLFEYVPRIYVSEEIGFSKPDKKAFDFVLGKINISPSQVLMIGDSFEIDIQGARNAGISGILVDRMNKYNDICRDVKIVKNLIELTNYIETQN
jgi:HAD superfamily hydrolase (TIGR01549 family)